VVTLGTTGMKLPWLGVSVTHCIYRFYWVLRLNTMPLTALSCIGDCVLECRNQGFLIAGTRFVIMHVVPHYCPNHIHYKSLLVHQVLGFSTLSTLRLVNFMNPHSFFIRISIVEKYIQINMNIFRLLWWKVSTMFKHKPQFSAFGNFSRYPK